jgi:hypothetical protein
LIDHERRLRELLPDAEVHLSGSASLSVLEPADLDLVVLVGDVEAAAADRLAEYRALRESPVDYDVRKREFFEQVVALL